MAKKKAAKKVAKKSTRTVSVSKINSAGTLEPVLQHKTLDAAFEYLQKLTDTYTTPRDERIKASKEFLLQACPELFGAGIAHIHAEYNGEGDSGDLEYMWAEDVGNKMITWPGEVEYLKDKVQTAIWEFIPSGFEIDDGSFGTVSIDMVSRKITREHKVRVIEINEQTHEFDF